MLTFSTKIVESISNGVPVITNETSDICTYIKNSKNGIIINKDISTSIKILTQLLPIKVTLVIWNTGITANFNFILIMKII